MPLKIVPPIPGRTPYWYIRGTLYGRTICASTKARDKAAAKRFKEQFELKLASSVSLKRPAATFREAASLYLDFRRPTLRRDHVIIERLAAVLGERLLSDIRQHILVEAANVLYPRCSPETKNRMALTPAAAVLHYAAENDLCPYIKVRKLKEKQPEARALSKDQAAVLMANAAGKLKTLLVFLFCQGWRVTDTLRLRWQDLNLAEGTVRYHVSKTDEWRTMPLHASVIAELRAMPTAIGRVFPWQNKSNLYRELYPFCRSLGIHFTPHMARHSFATWLVNEGVTVPELMEAGGWKDHKSVLRYARVDAKRVRGVINKIKA
jgi:integrase